MGLCVTKKASSSLKSKSEHIFLASLLSMTDFVSLELCDGDKTLCGALWDIITSSLSACKMQGLIGKESLQFLLGTRSSHVMQETEAESFFSTSELSERDDFVIDAVQAETEYFDRDPAAICCFNLLCKCGKKLRYGKNPKAVQCNFKLECSFNRMHAWTYHCPNCSLGQNFNACSFCLLDKGFMLAFNQFNSSNMVKTLSGDKSLGFYQALKPLHCVHIISIVHDIFREQWPLIPIFDICCIDMGHGRGQMAMLMARVFGFALGCDVQKDLARTVVTTLLSEKDYDRLLDRVLLMQCDLSRFNSFNGKKYNHIFE
jgi:hypothetical protein